MIRKSLNIGDALILDNKKFFIKDIKGNGANCIVYEAYYEDDFMYKHNVIIKENYPYSAQIKREGKSLIWESKNEKKLYNKAFLDTYEKLMKFQDNNSSVNTFGLFDTNNTKYIVMDYNEGVTFDKDRTNLKETLKTIKLLSYVVGEYHKKGYLHLDIKPENFLVFPRPSEHIVLFDVDSVIAMKDIISNRVRTVSYSDDWAAPEQKQGDIKKLSPATDIFSIGAILFEKIMGRKVGVNDISIFSDWEIEGETFLNINPKIKRLLRVIFKNTLNANSKRRYQTTKELINILDIAIKTCDEKLYIVSNIPALISDFVGRENELSEIENCFSSGKKAIFLSGNGGIGKSTVAIKYATVVKSDYDAVLFYRYRGTVDSIVDTIVISNLSSEDKYNKKAILSEIFNSGKYLLIVDNFDVTIDEVDLEELLKYNADFLFTTRTDFSEYSGDTTQINIDKLTESELIKVFENASGKNIETETDKKHLKKLLKLIGFHTYATELLGAQVVASDYSVVDLFEKVKNGLSGLSGSEKIKAKKDGKVKKDRTPEIISAVFKVSDLSEEKKQVLRNMFLLNFLNITREDYVKYTQCSVYEMDELNELVEQRYIIKNKALYSLHPLIDELVKNELDPNDENCTWVYKTIWNLIEQIEECDDDFTIGDKGFYGNSLVEYRRHNRNMFLCSFFYHVDLKIECNRSLLFKWLFALIESEEYFIGSPFSINFSKLYEKIEILMNYNILSQKEIFIIEYIIFCAWLSEYSSFYVYNDDIRYEKRDEGLYKHFDKAILSTEKLDGLDKDYSIEMIYKKIAYIYNEYPVIFLPEEFIKKRKEERPELFKGFEYTPIYSEDNKDKERNYEQEFLECEDKYFFLKSILTDTSLSVYERINNVYSCVDYATSWSHGSVVVPYEVDLSKYDWNMIKKAYTLIDEFLWDENNEPVDKYEQDEWQFIQDEFTRYGIIISAATENDTKTLQLTESYINGIIDLLNYIPIDDYTIFNFSEVISVFNLVNALLSINKGYLIIKSLLKYIEFFENYYISDNSIQSFLFHLYEKLENVFYFASKEENVPDEYKYDYESLHNEYHRKMDNIAKLGFSLREREK